MPARTPRRNAEVRSVTHLTGPGLGRNRLVVLGLLLLLPGLAFARLAGNIPWPWLVGVPLVASLFAFAAYGTDKRRAMAGKWRIPESTLHAAALLGGWPGAFVAQQLFRHKTRKTSFQATFWCIVLLHQGLALDVLLDGRIRRALVPRPASAAARAHPVADPRLARLPPESLARTGPADPAASPAGEALDPPPLS